MAPSNGLEVADIVRRFGPAFRETNHGKLSRAHLRTLGAIETCRTAALGGHVYECADCGARKIVYNSCRNRHCPKCQSLEKERWLQERCAELLPVPYFHVVFTLPEELNPLAVSHPRLLYNVLFQCASETLLEIAADPKHLGARRRAAPRSGPEGSTAMIWMILPLIAQFQCLSAQPWSEELVYLAGTLRYNRLHEIAVQEPKHAADPFTGRSSESLTAALRAGVEAGRMPREGPAKD